jgi:transcriptional antiterminator RfaH
MTNFKIGWHLIYTRPHQERKVATQLQEKDIQAYLPLTNEKRIWSDRIKIIHSPIFPSYVFVFLNNLQEYYNGIGTEGSCYFVKFDNQMARVSDSDISNIRMMEKSGENVEVTDNIFQTGQKLIIRRGLLSGLSCEVVQHKGKKRILVRVDMLQRHLVADLPFSALSTN